MARREKKPVHYVPDKDRKAFTSDLKTIYHASDEEKARLALDRVTEKWTAKYPNSMKRWYDNWDAITPIFKFFTGCRKGYLHDLYIPLLSVIPPVLPNELSF